MTFIQFTDVDLKVSIIQTKEIRGIKQMSETRAIVHMEDGSSSFISVNEMNRIAPLLIPAPAEPVEVASGSYSQGFQDGIDHARTKGAPARGPELMDELEFAALLDAWHLARISFAYTDAPSGVRVEKAYAELRDYVFNLAPSPLPTALINAYRAYLRISRQRGALHQGEIGPSYDEMDRVRNDVLDLLGANMPTEEIDHE